AVGLEKERSNRIAACDERKARVLGAERHEGTDHRVFGGLDFEETPAADRWATRRTVHDRMRRATPGATDWLEDRDRRIGEEQRRGGQPEALLDAPRRRLRQCGLIGRERKRVDEVVHALEDLHPLFEAIALGPHLFEREERRNGRGRRV